MPHVAARSASARLGADQRVGGARPRGGPGGPSETPLSMRVRCTSGAGATAKIRTSARGSNVLTALLQHRDAAVLASVQRHERWGDLHLRSNVGVALVMLLELLRSPSARTARHSPAGTARMRSCRSTPRCMTDDQAQLGGSRGERARASRPWQLPAKQLHLEGRPRVGRASFQMQFR